MNYGFKNKIKSIIHDSLFMIRAKGFTLIELMVVISITAILGALGIAGFINYNQTQVLQTSSNEVAAMLNLAKSRAQSQVKLGSLCNAPSQTLEGYKVDISTVNKSYTLSSRCSGNSSLLTTKTLPQNVNFTSPSSFFFPVQTGGVQTPGQIVISDNGEKTKTIIINSLGGVSIQ